MANQLERQNDVEETARLLYDMQAPGIVLSGDSYYTGGFANKHHPTEAEIEEARQNNDNIRRQSIANINKRRDSLALSINDTPSSSWSSRRMSVTDSMKDFFKARRSTKT
ncbi:uncharacterized protein PV06_05694 [Exophiala oligosperma]|uniref:Uncharacterized protein n=1 Tax=Exophiala oligosperma TaxID=215243 RepID=A0A0D2E2W1_9EURO|nr:uncharacterized protein PV06_05694 [Exophiala oligosperma]KIW42109.1 hypothetical protein PV06_05694 [Exophiala oligosperma]